MGIVGSFMKDTVVFNKLKELWGDKNELVKQASAISLGFINQQKNPDNDNNAKEAMDIMIKCIENKYENLSVKMGCLMGLGIMFSSGQTGKLRILGENQELI